MRRLILAAFLGVLSLSLAQASIIPTFVSMSNLGGGIFAYSYDIYVESPGERIQFSTQAGVGGVPPAGSNNHFTFFDFFGYVPGSASCSGSSSGSGFCGDFTPGVSNVGPGAYLQTPTDSASTPNVTWTFNADDTTIPAGSYLGRFTLESTSGNQGTIQFAGQSTKDGGPQGGTVTGNIVNTIGPGGPLSAVPEPGTVALLGMGLAGVAFLKRRAAGR